MDLSHAIDAHAQWKSKFRIAIKDRTALDAAKVGKDDQCELGKWIHASRAQLGAKADFEALRVAHAEFHVIAGKLAGLINAGRFDEAAVMLDSPVYTKASQVVAVAIVTLQSSLKRAA